MSNGACTPLEFGNYLFKMYQEPVGTLPPIGLSVAGFCLSESVYVCVCVLVK